VLCAGFPCQPFSLAGSKRGFADPRGSLFFEIVRVLDAKRPAAFFLDNVRGLQSHDKRRTLEVIRRCLTEDLGYSFHVQVVRACDFGLPQLRQRLFMVGFREPRTAFGFPEPIPLTITMDDIMGGRCDRRIGYTIMASGRGQSLEPRRCRAWDAYLVDGQLRRLTPRQARIMQGFPASFVLPESVPQTMKQLGNSVAIPAVEATARQIVRSLGYRPQHSSEPCVRPASGSQETVRDAIG
jgi:DNA (cytosine-5)-methyltransferase 1